jgi:hypothetical protein
MRRMRGITAAKRMRRFTSAGGSSRSAVRPVRQAIVVAGAGPVDSRTTSSGAITISAG